MSLNTFFRYFGSKWSSAPRYPAPLHETVIEPFAGSAGYATRYHRRKVILVEKNPELATLWRYLIRVSAGEILRLPDMPGDGSVDDLPVIQEARILISYNVQRGLDSRGTKLSLWAKDDPHTLWGPVLRARLAAQVERIRHWRIIEGDYWQAPGKRATWFVDPPYQRFDRYKWSGRHLDFPALGRWCRARRGQVMVCEAKDADWLPFRVFGTVRATMRGNGKPEDGTSAELIWTKGCAA